MAIEGGGDRDADRVCRGRHYRASPAVRLKSPAGVRPLVRVSREPGIDIAR